MGTRSSCLSRCDSRARPTFSTVRPSTRLLRRLQVRGDPTDSLRRRGTPPPVVGERGTVLNQIESEHPDEEIDRRVIVLHYQRNQLQMGHRVCYGVIGLTGGTGRQCIHAHPNSVRAKKG